MTSTLIDASARSAKREEGDRKTATDKLRQTVRVALADRPMLAARLGEIAAKLDSDQPARAAKRWFDRAWQGDRWAKRKRLLILPGEALPDAKNEGAFVASGADWAALLEQATHALHPGSDLTAANDRKRAERDLLRGTSFLPALPPISLKGDNLQSLVAVYAGNAAAVIEGGSAIRRLWEVLTVSPFKVSCYTEDCQNMDTALFQAAARASEASVGRYPEEYLADCHFEPDPAGEDQDWAWPRVRLGLRGHRRTSRMFVVPQTVIDSTPDAPDVDVSVEEHVGRWLCAEGILTGKPFEGLPDMPYDVAKGYGWRPFSYDIVQHVNLCVRPKPDGTTGLWIRANHDETLVQYFPVDDACDTVAIEARYISFGGGPFGSFWLGGTELSSAYLLITWPTYAPMFMKGGQLPDGAASGLVEDDDRDFPDVSGWIDDLENREVQDLLYGFAPDIRFVPSVVVDRHTPTPCSERAVASVLFRNRPVGFDDRIDQGLLEEADRISKAGLAYHDAVFAHHRTLIERMVDND